MGAVYDYYADISSRASAGAVQGSDVIALIRGTTVYQSTVTAVLAGIDTSNFALLSGANTFTSLNRFNAGIESNRYSDSAYPYLDFNRTRGTSGTPTQVQDTDVLGELAWFGQLSGGSMSQGAGIKAVVNGSTAGNRIPTDLVFSTRVSNGLLTEAGRFTTAQLLTLANPLAVTSGGTGSTSFAAGSIPFSSGTMLTERNNGLFWDNTNQRLGLNLTSPTATLDVSGNNFILGSDTSQITRTNSNPKVARILLTHELSAEEQVTLLIANSQSPDNGVYFGGGSSAFNAATALHFYTGATTTTLTGTERLTVGSTGLVGINRSSSIGAQLDVLASTTGTVGLIVDTQPTPTQPPVQIKINAVTKSQFATTGFLAIGVDSGATGAAFPVDAWASASGTVLQFATSAGGGQAARIGIDTSALRSYLRLSTSATYGWQIQGPSSQSWLDIAPAGHTFTQDARTTGSPTALTVTGGAHTTLTASAEAPFTNFNAAQTSQWATGALALQRTNIFQAQTAGFVGASTITDFATVAITGGGIKGTNASVTNSHGLLIQAGAIGAATNGYGLTCNAPTGATNNYAANFVGGPALFANGTSGAPSLSFASSPTVGAYITGTNGLVSFVHTGTTLLQFGSTNLVVKGIFLDVTNADVSIQRSSSGVLKITDSGGTNPGALITGQPTTGTVGQIVYCAPSTLANAQEWRASGGSSGYVTVGPDTLPGNSGTKNWLNVTGTTPSTMSAQTTGILFAITGAGSSAQELDALSVLLKAGYTGSNYTIAMNGLNSSAGTGTGLLGGASNYGTWFGANATTTGTNTGGYLYAEGGNINCGGLGQATVAKNSATNIGLAGFALNTGTSPTQIGVFGGLMNATPTWASAAGLFDNGSTTSDILNLRDNGTTVWKLADGGTVTHSGHYLFSADNTYDIGASGATRPRNIFTGAAARIGTNLFVGDVSTSGVLGHGTRGYISFNADGVWSVGNNAASDFGRLQFGGTTSSFPALGRSTIYTSILLADGTAGGGLSFSEGANEVYGTTTGTKLGTSTTQKIGFWNATPVVQDTGWSMTNYSVSRTLDRSSYTLDQLGDVVCTLIETVMKGKYGLLGA